MATRRQARINALRRLINCAKEQEEALQGFDNPTRYEIAQIRAQMEKRLSVARHNEAKEVDQ